MGELADQLKPNSDEITRHMEATYGDQTEGYIELAWTEPYGALKNAEMFDVGDLDTIAEKAEALNATEGVNVYYGQALRHDNIAKTKRATDADVFVLTSVYCDLDDDGSAEAARTTYTEVGVKPTSIVITGHHPYTRAQLHWRLDDPIHDPAEMRAINSAIANTFNGDPTVVNPSRVLRLPGTIAWPHKAGRVAEMTQLIDNFPDNRPKRLAVEHLARVFSTPPVANAGAVKASPPDGPGPLVSGITSPEQLLADIKADKFWWNNMVKLTGHYVSLGWTDAEILAIVPEITLPGHDQNKTIKEVKIAVDGGRKKWDVPDPAENKLHTPLPDAGPFAASSLIGDPPPRIWVWQDWMPFGTSTILFGDGGVGKTLIAHQLANAVSQGEEFMGFETLQSNVLMVMCEDDKDEIHRRQNNISEGFGNTKPDNLWLWDRVGAENLLMVFDGRDTGTLTPLWYQIRDFCIENHITVVVFDTAADMFGGNEIIRKDVNQFIKAACTRMAIEISGTALVLAHPSVAGMASGTGMSGSTAWNNAVRSRMYLTRPTEDTPNEMDENTRLLTRKKANYAKEGEEIFMEWTDGRFVHCADNKPRQSQMSVARTSEIFVEIEKQWLAGTPFSMAQQSPRCLTDWMVTTYKISKKSAKSYQNSWLTNMLLKSERYDTTNKKDGLKVVQHPGNIYD